MAEGEKKKKYYKIFLAEAEMRKMKNLLVMNLRNLHLIG